VRLARPQRLERLAEENRSGSCASDPVARKHSLAEPIYHVGRAQTVERLAEEVEPETRSPRGRAQTVERLAEEVALETRSPRGRARVLAHMHMQAKTFQLLLAGLAFAQVRFQRDSLREPDV
jgi:hypothetical protein